MTKENSNSLQQVTETLIHVASGVSRQLHIRHLVRTAEEQSRLTGEKMSPAVEQSYNINKLDLKTRVDASTVHLSGQMGRIDTSKSDLRYNIADIARRLYYLTCNGRATTSTTSSKDADGGNVLFKLHKGSADMQVLEAFVTALENAASAYETLLDASSSYNSVTVWLGAINRHYSSYEANFVSKSGRHKGNASLRDSAMGSIKFMEDMYNGLRIQHTQQLLQVNPAINNLRQLEEEIVRRLLNRNLDKACPKLQWLVVDCIYAMRQKLEKEHNCGRKSARNDIHHLLLDEKPSFRQLRAVARDSALHDANRTVHWLLHRGY